MCEVENVCVCIQGAYACGSEYVCMCVRLPVCMSECLCLSYSECVHVCFVLECGVSECMFVV